jgi:16S rRNA (cytosine1402-N4)-methyltransferase
MTMAAEVMPEPSPPHTSVLVAEVSAAFAPITSGTILDVTAGWGGHSQALLAAHPGIRVIAFDRDPHAVRAATERLLPFGKRAEVVHLRFSEVLAWLRERGLPPVQGLLADLGVSSPQLDGAERGLTFRKEGPIDMRMDPTRGKTALEIIREASQEELAGILFNYGEERRSRRVAACIKQALDEGHLETTMDLRRAVVRAVGPRRSGGVDPATRTFQGLRIAVNEELTELDALLECAPRLVAPGGIAAMISFHSLEDRQAKRTFNERETWLRLTKKPIVAGESERDLNPRSRSAKLRVAERRAEGGMA